MKRTITDWNIACYTHTHTHLIFHLMSSSTLIDPPLCCSTWPLWAFSLWSSRGRHRARQPTNWWTPWRTRTSCTGSTVCRSWSRSASLRRRPSGGCTARGESLQPAAGRRSPDTPSVLLCTEGGRLVTTRTSALWNTLTMSQKSLYSALRDSSPQILQLFNRMPQYLKWNHPDLESF